MTTPQALVILLMWASPGLASERFEVTAELTAQSEVQADSRFRLAASLQPATATSPTLERFVVRAKLAATGAVGACSNDDLFRNGFEN